MCTQNTIVTAKIIVGDSTRTATISAIKRTATISAIKRTTTVQTNLGCDVDFDESPKSVQEQSHEMPAGNVSRAAKISALKSFKTCKNDLGCDVDFDESPKSVQQKSHEMPSGSFSRAATIKAIKSFMTVQNDLGCDVDFDDSPKLIQQKSHQILCQSPQSITRCVTMSALKKRIPCDLEDEVSPQAIQRRMTHAVIRQNSDDSTREPDSPSSPSSPAEVASTPESAVKQPRRGVTISALKSTTTYVIDDSETSDDSPRRSVSSVELGLLKRSQTEKAQQRSPRQKQLRNKSVTFFFDEDVMVIARTAAEKQPNSAMYWDLFYLILPSMLYVMFSMELVSLDMLF
jgi:hypothetical protein